MGTVLKSQGKPEEALAAYKKALVIDADYAEAYNNMGTVLSGQGNPKEALVAFKKALEIKPDFSQASAGMGECLLKIGKFEEGRSLIHKTEGSISL